MTVDDRGAGALTAVRSSPAFGFPRARVQVMMEALQRAIPGPELKVVVAGTARRQVLRQMAPRPAGLQDIQHPVQDRPHLDTPPAARPRPPRRAGGIKGAISAHSSSVKSLG